MSNESYKLFVGGLPEDCHEDDLRIVFSTYGTVTNVVMLQPGQSGQRCAFVFYDDYESAEDAIYVLNGVYKIRETAREAIVVKWGKDSKRQPTHGAGRGDSDRMDTGEQDGYDDSGGDWGEDTSNNGSAGGTGAQFEGYKLFCGGLEPDISEDHVRSVFATYGDVVAVKMLSKPGSSGAKGAFVFYRDQEDAEDAIKVLHGAYKIRQYATKPINVCWAKSHKGDPRAAASGPAQHERKKTENKGNWSNRSVGGSSWEGNGGRQAIGNDTAGKQRDEEVAERCRSPGCNFLVHSGGEMGKYCCGKCWGSQGSGHGPYCERRLAPEGDPASAAAGGSGRGRRGDQAQDDSRRKIYVANLPDDTTQEVLSFVMAAYGPVESVFIMNGKNVKGCISAFVMFKDPEDAETAINTLHDKYEIRKGYGPLVVKYADPKTVRWAPY